MNDKTMQVLTDLAEKLGTTAEYLWAALLRQAPISGLADLALMAGWISATVIWTKIVIRKAPTWEKEYEEDRAIFAWIGVILLWISTAYSITAGLSLTISAFLNPEYWALKQILK